MTKYVALPVEPTEEIRDAINTHLNEYGHHEDCTMLWEAIKEAVSQPDVVVVEREKLSGIKSYVEEQVKLKCYCSIEGECHHHKKLDDIKQLLEGAG